MIATIKNFLNKVGSPGPEKSAVEAYDNWSDSYDLQPGNLMLDLDEKIFAGLIENIDLKNKNVADIGCGTGRHWPKLYGKNPALLMGFDVSEGMLRQLRRKFPAAPAYHTTDNLLKTVPDTFADCIVTTLAIAHIKNIEQAIAVWSRVLKVGGDLVITDFHPATLAIGGKRSYVHRGRTFSVINYVHPLEKVKNVFKKFGLTVVKQEEKYIDEETRWYYEAQNALPVYARFRGMPIIYGLHLNKKNAAR